MSYLPNRKRKIKRITSTIVVIVFVLVLLIYTPLLSGLGAGGVRVVAFFSHIGGNVTHIVKNIGSIFYSKKSMNEENAKLTVTITQERARISGLDIIMAENTALKEILGRSNITEKLLLAIVLAKPNQSPYDTLIIDVGENQNVHIGDEVFADGSILIGHVGDVYGAQSKVKLFSTSGEETTVRFTGSNNDFIMKGRGGGSFEFDAPKTFIANVGDTVFIPGISSSIVAEVVKVVSNENDPAEKVFLRSPVNIFGLNFVEVKRHASIPISNK